MASVDDVPVIEGFICPICKSDLGTTENLLSHFQEQHSEEQDVLKTLKDLLDKAKKKILKQDSFSTLIVDLPRDRELVQNHDFFYEPQQLGVTVSHTSFLNMVREERLQRLSVPTNQLIIRLEKLLDNMPSDPQKRKVHEQNIVPWIDGTDVPRCPNCAGSFGLTKRKHHCRLCGSVMCNECSRFMDIITAMKILEKPAKDLLPDDKIQSGGDSQRLRLCVHCTALLEVREEKRLNQKSKPIISQFYERLVNYRTEAQKLADNYREMVSSLNSGSTTYSLKETQAVKVKLFRLSESIDAVSSKIAVLGTDSDYPPASQALKLQNMIRTACAMYLRQQALTLPNLPTEEELERIQRRRREQATARIQEDKMRKSVKLSNSVTQKPITTSPSKNQLSEQLQLSLGEGWVPENNEKANETEDPLIEQMNKVRTYIKLAKMGQRTDEVACLEENLQFLKSEFLKKQQLQEDTYSSYSEGSFEAINPSD